MQPAKIADGVAGMERGLIEKCNQIKESRALISQLLTQTAGLDTKDSQTQIEIISKNAETQMDTSGKKSNFGQQADTAPKEIIKEVEKIVTQTVKELIEVEKIIEKPVFTERVQVVEKIVPVTIEVEKVQLLCMTRAG